MPRKLSRAQRLLATIGGAVCLAGALPGAALAAECPVQPTLKAFAEFGDENSYYLAPGGAFEALTWARVGNVDLTFDSDPFELAPGTRSVRLHNGESVSGVLLRGSHDAAPALRRAARRRRPRRSQVRTVYAGAVTIEEGSLDRNEFTAWSPTEFVSLRTGSIPSGQSGTSTVTLRSTGDWRIDNVFVDPYRR